MLPPLRSYIPCRNGLHCAPYRTALLPSPDSPCASLVGGEEQLGLSATFGARERGSPQDGRSTPGWQSEGNPRAWGANLTLTDPHRPSPTLTDPHNLVVMLRLALHIFVPPVPICQFAQRCPPMGLSLAGSPGPRPHLTFNLDL